MRVFSRLDHPNIVKCVSATQHMNFALIQMEYAHGGDLGKLAEQQKNIPEDTVKMIAVQILSALHYLKKYHVLHRDIKLQNIMI